MAADSAEAKARSALQRISWLLNAQTGHTLAEHKPGLILLQVQWRMELLQLQSLEHYLTYLERTPDEVSALLQDLLVGLTQFFRDTHTFETLQTRIIPALLKDKVPGGVIRVWVAGCSSGEEAYSIAILMHESLVALKIHCTVQIFATDINTGAIAIGHRGHYPPGIAKQLSAERLEKYFTADPDGNGYRIQPFIRDMLIFAEHDVAEDPPFSRIDLLSCRNLLLYMEDDTQRRLLRIFHYALLPGGFLVLGSSENSGDRQAFFTSVECKANIYQRKMPLPHPENESEVPADPSTNTLEIHVDGSAPQSDLHDYCAMPTWTLQAGLQYVAAHGALINSDGDILCLGEALQACVNVQPGAAHSRPLLKMARNGFGLVLQAALDQARRSSRTVQRTYLGIDASGNPVLIPFTVQPVNQTTALQRPLFLLRFPDFAQRSPETCPLELDRSSKVTMPMSVCDPDALRLAERVASLRSDVQAETGIELDAQQDLQMAHDQPTAHAEAMQLLHEQLQSVGEELKTSKEQLLTVNKALLLSHGELQQQIAELRQLHNDVHYLLAGSGNGAIFVDQKQRILRFTPAICAFLHLKKADLGRPIGDFVCHLGNYDQLAQDIQTVLDTLATQERKVQSTAGKWYRMQLQPYRTQDNLVEGAVITLMECRDQQPVSLTAATSV